MYVLKRRVASFDNLTVGCRSSRSACTEVCLFVLWIFLYDFGVGSEGWHMGYVLSDALNLSRLCIYESYEFDGRSFVRYIHLC